MSLQEILMANIRVFFLICCILFFQSNRTFADDTVVGLGSGGLEFRTTNKVSMLKERLTISPKAIDARYTFRNVTDHPVELMVAFPLPVIDFSKINPHGPYINIPNSHSANFVDFKTIVDGRAVSTLTETKAFVGDKDISIELKKAGIRFWIPGYGTDYGLNTNEARVESSLDSTKQVRALPKSVQQHLVKIGALKQGPQEDDAFPFPNWRLVTLYFWTQVFPARKDVIIHHTYQPISTMSEGFNIQSYDEKTMQRLPLELIGGANARYPKHAANLKQYCMTDDFFAAAKTRTAFKTYAIDFILKTANAWHKPIGEFTLVLETDDPENLVSICINGMKRTSPTSFEVTKYNFAPSEDLKIFFLKK